MSLTRAISVRSVAFSIRRYTKFIIVGLMNSVVDVFVLNILLWLFPWHSSHALTIYNTIAVVAAIINSYIWNRRWTFRDSVNGSRYQRMMFFAQALLNIALNDIIVVFFSAYLVFNKSVPFFVSSNASKLLAMMVSSSLSYLLLRKVVFRSGPQK